MNKYLHVSNDFEDLILAADFHSTDLWCSTVEAWITGCLENQQARQTEKLEEWYKLGFLRGSGTIQWRPTRSSVREAEQQSKGVKSCCWKILLWGRNLCLLQMRSACSDHNKVSPMWKVARWNKRRLFWQSKSGVFQLKSNRFNTNYCECFLSCIFSKYYWV